MTNKKPWLLGMYRIRTCKILITGCLRTRIDLSGDCRLQGFGLSKLPDEFDVFHE